MTEDQIRELFREMRDEPVPADSRARVRMAIAERTQSWRERLRKHWKIAAAVLVPACVALAMVVWRPAPPVVVQKVVAQPEVVAEMPVQLSVPEDLPRPVVRARHRVVKQARIPEAATLIRIETPDPDVVILLIGG